MQIDKVFETINITHDDKARRVLNTAPDKVADITLNEIEKGITIERLGELTVPVYRYGGQVTIHGIFKDIPDDLRVHGYKSVFRNGNGSLGVKYVAIDGDKKHLLNHVSRYSKTKWGIHINSQGCEAIRVFHSNDRDNDIQRLKDCFNSTPDDLYVGNKSWASLMYGGFAVIIYIGAIYQDNLWPLIKALTGIASQAEYDTIHAEAEAEYKRLCNEGETKRKLEAEAKAIEIQTIRANFAVPLNWVEFKGKLTEPGTYAHLRDTWTDGIALQVIKIAKRGGRICSNSKTFKDFVYVDWQPSGFKQTERSIDGWRIADTVKTAPVTAKPQSVTKQTDVKPQPDIVISHNDKLNGIEIKFANKPTDDILCKLKSFGFRWSYKSMLWYSRYTDNLWQSVTNEFKVGVC
jgi:hypothetical protein